jgi:hypothetical protein
MHCASWVIDQKRKRNPKSSIFNAFNGQDHVFSSFQLIDYTTVYFCNAQTMAGTPREEKHADI